MKEAEQMQVFDVEKSNKRFFIFVGGGIGDVLMTTPLFRGLKERYPDAYIAASVMGVPQSIILKNNNNVDDVINLGAKEYQGWKGTFKLVRYLRLGKFDYSSLNHVAERRNFFLSGFLAGIKVRIGYNRLSIAREKTYKYFLRLLTHQLPYKLGARYHAQLNLDILKLFGIQNSDLSYDLGALKNLPVDEQTHYQKSVGIHAGCDARGGDLKRWDLENFIELGRLIQQKAGYEVKFYIGPSEANMVPFLKDEFTLVQGKTLEQVIADISTCSYFISNDSGLAHLAAAMQVPTMVIFGSTKGEFVLPTKFMAVENNTVMCRPCYHTRKPCSIGRVCLTSISGKDVFNKFLQFAEESSISEAEILSDNLAKAINDN